MQKRVGAISPFVFSQREGTHIEVKEITEKTGRKRENRKPLCTSHAIKWLSGSDSIYSTRQAGK